MKRTLMQLSLLLTLCTMSNQLYSYTWGFSNATKNPIVLKFKLLWGKTYYHIVDPSSRVSFSWEPPNWYAGYCMEGFEWAKYNPNLKVPGITNNGGRDLIKGINEVDSDKFSQISYQFNPGEITYLEDKLYDSTLKSASNLGRGFDQFICSAIAFGRLQVKDKTEQKVVRVEELAIQEVINNLYTGLKNKDFSQVQKVFNDLNQNSDKWIKLLHGAENYKKIVQQLGTVVQRGKAALLEEGIKPADRETILERVKGLLDDPAQRPSLFTSFYAEPEVWSRVLGKNEFQKILARGVSEKVQVSDADAQANIPNPFNVFSDAVWNEFSDAKDARAKKEGHISIARDVLGVSESATLLELKNSQNKLARIWNPTAVSADKKQLAGEVTKFVQAAYDVLVAYQKYKTTQKGEIIVPAAIKGLLDQVYSAIKEPDWLGQSIDTLLASGTPAETKTVPTSGGCPAIFSDIINWIGGLIAKSSCGSREIQIAEDKNGQIMFYTEAH